MQLTFTTKNAIASNTNQGYKSTEAVYYSSYATAVLMQFWSPETTPIKARLISLNIKTC